MSTSPDNTHPFQAQRQAMVEEQLRLRGVDDARVLAAMAAIPRHLFVPPEALDQAYSDRALSIDCEQTISQPLIVGMMTQALRVEPGHRVLEIGTGSGYQAAVLAQLADEVISIERHPHLAEQARRRLADLGYENVTVLVGDGSLGCPDRAPFDRVIVTAAAEECPRALIEQLREGGRLVGPFGPPSSQVLRLLQKRGGEVESSALSGCRFVPLVADEARE